MQTRRANATGRPLRTLTSQAGAALVVAAIGLGSIACSSKDEAPPLATPSVTLPSGKVQAGRPADVKFRFAVSPSAPPFAEDYVVFVHGIDDGGKRIWTSDHQPPKPTRQWKAGDVIEYTHAMNVPRNTPEGRVAIEIGLYSPQSRDRLPLSGENNGKRAYRVASIGVASAAEDTSTMYIDGWHSPEAPEDAQEEWRWTTGAATVWLRNPKRDTALVLVLDQPSAAFTETQHVTVRTGTKVLDSFDLPQGKRVTRRIPMTVTDLGDGTSARLNVDVDKTFVPAKLPNANNRDARELGVRVFHVYLDPGAE